MIGKNARAGMEQLRANAGRSVLTIGGVVIAVASTILVVSVVQGLTGYVSGFLRGFGTNAMWVWAERPEGEAGESLGRVELDERDVEALGEECPAVARISPLVRQPAGTVRLGRAGGSSPLEGVGAEYTTIRNYEVELGRPLSALDIAQAHRVCLIGEDLLDELGGDEGVVGEDLLIDGHLFEVVGLLRPKGSFFGISQDDVVMVPYTTALRMYPPMRRSLAVAAQATTEEAVPEAKAQVANLLRRRHELDASQPNDFQVRTQDEVLEIFGRMSLVAVVTLAAIAGVSLLVGGIGIMNVMLVGVAERTREIGLRKAVGARRRDIFGQFLAEAVTLALLGGAAGIALGCGLTALASLHPQMVDVSVPWWSVALGFGVSAGTGVVFGLLPAVRAALLNPIDALRHE